MSSSSSTPFHSFSEELEDNGRGFPNVCRCGIRLVMRTSTTRRNPGRLFYCCPRDFPGCRENHTWKWTDVAVVEEVEDLKNLMCNRDEEIIRLQSKIVGCEKRLKLVVVAGAVLGCVYWLFQ